MTAVGPLSLNILAPAMPGLIVTFDADAGAVQACVATCGSVIARAVSRDLYERDRAASMIGWVTMAMVVAPMIAPLIGGALDSAYGWQSIFAFVGLFAAAVLVWTVFQLPE